MLKDAADQLAILGGSPAFEQMLHVGRPNLGDYERFAGRMEQVFASRWLTNDGPLVREFEERVCELLEVRNCVATTNATLGLQLSAHALELTGEVIVPAFTFVATAHCLRWLGLDPVFCDVDPLTHNLDPVRVAELITPRTSAILGVHLWGRPCDVDALEQLARAHDLRLIFDAAHAFGCSHQGQPIGGFGDAEVFSFHATKFVNAFEGGAVTTDDDELADRLRLARNFGFETLDRVVALGTNAKMSEACAAMGLTSLEAMEQIVARNRANHEVYRRELADVPGLTVAGYASPEAANHQYVVLEVDPDECGITRDVLMSVLHAENVFARRYFYPGCHRMEPYASEDPTCGERLAVTERIADQVLVLPTGTALTPEDVEVVCRIIRLAVRSAPTVIALPEVGALRT